MCSSYTRNNLMKIRMSYCLFATMAANGHSVSILLLEIQEISLNLYGPLGNFCVKCRFSPDSRKPDSLVGAHYHHLLHYSLNVNSVHSFTNPLLHRLYSGYIWLPSRKISANVMSPSDLTESCLLSLLWPACVTKGRNPLGELVGNKLETRVANPGWQLVSN